MITIAVGSDGVTGRTTGHPRGNIVQVSIDVADTAVIERPIGDVSAFSGDPSNAPEWCRQVDTAEWETDPPTRLGSRIRYRGRWLGRPATGVFELAEHSPGEQVAIRRVAGPYPIEVIATWRPVGDRVTHLALQVHASPRGLRRLLTPLLARRLRRALTRCLADLRHQLER